MQLIIVESPGSTLVAKIDDYTGPIPHPGEYIFHPPLNPAENTADRAVHMNVMSVKTVTYGIIARPDAGQDHFIGNAEPFVEVHV